MYKRQIHEVNPSNVGLPLKGNVDWRVQQQMEQKISFPDQH